MKQDIYLTIEGNPVTKKNSSVIIRNPKTGRFFIVPSKQFQAYEKEAVKQIQFMPIKDVVTAEDRVNIRCVYYMKTDPYTTKRRIDLVNLLEATDDILQTAGILEDDNCTIVFSHDGSRVYTDKDHPRAEITISFLQTS